MTPVGLTERLESEADPADVCDRVAVTTSGGAAVVTLAWPQALNSLALASWRQLARVLEELAQDKRVRAVVLRGAGGRAFSVGADIAEFPVARTTAAAGLEYNRAVSGALRAVTACERPVVAMIGGLAVGGGCELAAACDLRIASDDSRFGIPIRRLGVTIGYSEASALVRLIGPGRLKDLLLTGRLIDAAEAYAIGLVERVVPRERLAGAAAEVVSAIVTAPAATMKAAKLIPDMCSRPLTEVDMDTVTELTLAAYDGADLREGVSAFIEKREPSFGAGEEEAH